MGNKTNLNFLNAFMEAEAECAKKLGVKRHGVTEYINRLSDAKEAPDRTDVLARLVRYRNVRNKLAHEADAISTVRDIGPSDVKWLKDFTKQVVRSKDSLSLHDRKLYRIEKWCAALKVIVPIALLLLASVAAAIILL